MIKTKKYLAIHLLNDFSGSPLVLANCIDAILAEGHRVELHTSGDDGFLTRCKCPKLRLVYKRFNSKLFTLMSFLICQLFLFISILLQTAFVKKEDKHIVLVKTILPFGAALAAKITRCQVIYYIHEVSIRPLILKWWLKLILRVTANKEIYVSNYLKEHYGCSNKNIQKHVIYNSLPPNKVIDDTTLKVNEFIVFMPASLKKYKGVYDFIELSEKFHFKNIKFILALNAEEHEFNEFINKLYLRTNLKIIRRPENIDSIYRQASLVLNLSNPSEWVETFGMTVIEAFSHGCPVIAPEVGGIAEIVEDDFNGFKISVTKLDDIYNKIELLSENTQLYSRLVNNSFISAKRYQFPYYKRKILEIL